LTTPAVKDRVWNILECNHNLRHPVLQALAGSQIERHARPAPGIDLGFERNESLRRAFRGDAGLVEITGDRLAVDRTRAVLPAHSLGLYGVTRDRPQCAQYFQL